MTFHAAHGEFFSGTDARCSGEDQPWMRHQMEEIITHQKLARRRTSFIQKTPALMVLSLLSGVILAIGHHFYYLSRAGTAVHDSNSIIGAIHSQQRILRVGLALAFLVNSLFITAVGLAYTQCVWSSVKLRGVTIGGLDALFSAIENPWALRKWEAWTTTPLGMILAFTAWTLPLTAVITTSTISIAPGITTIYERLPVPSISWVNTDAFFGDDYDHRYTTTAMKRIVSATVTGMAVLPFAAPSPSSSYEVEFHGPSLECDYVDPGTNQDFWVSALEATEVNSTAIKVGDYSYIPLTGVNDGSVVLAPNASQLFRAFVPYGEDSEETVIFSCLLNTSCPLSLIFSKDWDSTLYAPSCDISSPPALKCYTAMECWTRNTSFKAEISFTNGLRHIDLVSSLVPFSELDSEGYMPLLSDNTIAVFQSLLPYITGNLSEWGNDSGSRVMNLALLSTSLPGSAELKGFMNPDAGQLAVARGRNLSAILREISHNVSLSLLSNPAFASDPPTIGNVTHVMTVNIFVYKSGILGLAYGVATIATLFAVVIGLTAQTSNHSNYGRGFSSLLYATRNSDLDDLILELQNPSKAWNADTSKAQLDNTKLRFRYIGADSKGISVSEGHGAFALEAN